MACELASLDDVNVTASTTRDWLARVLSDEGTYALTPRRLKISERGLPEHGKRFAREWRTAVAGIASRDGARDELISSLEREANADIADSVEQLYGASRDCIAAWCSWYPRWIRDRIRTVLQDRPELLLSTDEIAERGTQSDAARKQRDRDVDLGQRLFTWLHAQPNGFAKWQPDQIARELAQRGPVPRIKPMADALVRLGVATWKVTPNGHKWALQLSGTGLSN